MIEEFFKAHQHTIAAFAGSTFAAVVVSLWLAWSARRADRTKLMATADLVTLMSPRDERRFNPQINFYPKTISTLLNRLDKLFLCHVRQRRLLTHVDVLRLTPAALGLRSDELCLQRRRLHDSEPGRQQCYFRHQ